MTRSRVTWLIGIALGVGIGGCHEINEPIAQRLPVPTTVTKTVGSPPELTISVSGARGFPPTRNYLLSYPWDTWVTLEAAGTVSFGRKPPIPGASPNYTALYPGRAVT